MSATGLGKRLKKARLDAGITQKEAAERLGVTFQAISNYERGTSRIKAETLLELCRIYGIVTADLLRTPTWTKEMFEVYNAASVEDRQHYIDLWGCPAELIEAENERREPDLSPLSAEDEHLLYILHRLPNPGTVYSVFEQLSQLNEEGQKMAMEYIDYLVTSARYKEDTSAASNKTNVVKFAARNGELTEERLTDEEVAARMASDDLLPDAEL